ncbi:MAG TPA: hypothetical protein VGI95_10630 [Caulobacteraceae bacterium]|jgi:hypothetical protein
MPNTHHHFTLDRRLGKTGLTCEQAGITLAGVALLRQTDRGLAPRPASEIERLTKAAYGVAQDADALDRGLRVAASALNEGDLSRAMIASLHLKLPTVSPDGAARLAAAEAELAKYSPEEPRDWRGRWTTGGSGARPSPLAPSPGHEAEDAFATPSSAAQLVSHPTSGHLFQVQGGNGPPPDEPEGDVGPEPEPPSPTGAPSVPPGWDVSPAYESYGVLHPAVRIPRLPDGSLWPTAEPDAILAIMSSGKAPPVDLYIPDDMVGPTLIGSTDKTQYPLPPGYSLVRFIGTPQETRSGNAATRHALESVVEALRMARTNLFSSVYFNRSVSTITGRAIASPLRADVMGVVWPELDVGYALRPYEIVSPGQTPEQQRARFRHLPGIGPGDARRYEKLLKVLRSLGLQI